MLLTLEGLDGSGKTTVCDGLAERYDGVFTREPTHSWYGEAVRRSLRTDDADSVAELFLYTADHADHLHSVIEPALEAGKFVVSDRYIDSRYAYQAATLEGTVDEPLAYIKRIHEPITRIPDLTLYFDIDPETAVKRSEQQNKFERRTHLQTVSAYYERVIEAEPDRFVRIDANAPPETVLQTAIDAIEARR